MLDFKVKSKIYNYLYFLINYLKNIVNIWKYIILCFNVKLFCYILNFFFIKSKVDVDINKFIFLNNLVKKKKINNNLKYLIKNFDIIIIYIYIRLISNVKISNDFIIFLQKVIKLEKIFVLKKENIFFKKIFYLELNRFYVICILNYKALKFKIINKLLSLLFFKNLKNNLLFVFFFKLKWFKYIEIFFLLCCFFFFSFCCFFFFFFSISIIIIFNYFYKVL